MAFGFECLRALPNKLRAKGIDIARATKKVGKDDPRRVIHSLKVGLALTLIALYYHFQPLYDGFGVNAMWAVFTVVLVFEFSVGNYLSFQTLHHSVIIMLSTYFYIVFFIFFFISRFRN